MDTVSGSKIATATPLPALCNIVKEVDALLRSRVPRGQEVEGIGMALPGVAEQEEGRVIYHQ